MGLGQELLRSDETENCGQEVLSVQQHRRFFSHDKSRGEGTKLLITSQVKAWTVKKENDGKKIFLRAGWRTGNERTA